jgi:hypothetical protein
MAVEGAVLKTGPFHIWQTAIEPFRSGKSEYVGDGTSGCAGAEKEDTGTAAVLTNAPEEPRA